MTSRPARFPALVASLLLVATGLIHAAHFHTAEEATTLHPVCTLCQFHAASATPGDGGVHLSAPDTSGPAVLPLCVPVPQTGVRGTVASRAPPELLAV